MKETYKYETYHIEEGRIPLPYPFAVIEEHIKPLGGAASKEVAAIGLFQERKHAEVFRVAMDRSKGN